MTLKNRSEARAWQKAYDAQAPKVGDLAPDFELFDNRGENPVRLSDFRGKKPVALVFGSFT
jgi:peroxiredoxin